jgi:hypothetical protein
MGRILFIVAVLMMPAALAPSTAWCEWCVPTFCGTSAECPGNCVCAIPWGQVTGECVGTGRK